MAVAPLRVTTAQLGIDTFVVSAAGELDLYTVDSLERELGGAVAAGASRVVVDLVAVTFIDSVALGAITRLARRLRVAQGELVVVADDRRIARVFEITGLNRVFRIERSLAEAVDQLVSRTS